MKVLARSFVLVLAVPRIALGVVLVLLACPAGHAQCFAYVSNTADDTVSVIDTSSLAVVATVPVGDDPVGVAVHPSGALVYV